MVAMRLEQRDAEFRAFLFAEAAKLRRLALFLVGDEEEEAADLAQDAMVSTYRSWHSIRGDDPGPYARRTLVNACNSHLRRLARRRKYASPVLTEAAGREGGVDDRLGLAEALRTLPPIRRATLVLRFYEDMAEADIARLLDRPLGPVKSDIHRSLKQLRPMLTDATEEAR